MPEFEINQLWIYPIKSLGGVPVQQAGITPQGSFSGDREWLVVDPAGRMLWQGDLPRMTLLQTAIDAGTLSITAPGGDRLELAMDHPGSTAEVTQYGFTFRGVDAGEDASTWLSTQLGTSCRLVRIGAQAHQWGKLNPVHIVSLHSLAELNRQLQGRGDPGVECRRFRPNIVLAGDHQPFDEERVASIAFARATLMLREPCVRCELPNISLQDASRGKQPLKQIGAMSKSRPTSKPASFGIYSLAIGEIVTVGARSVMDLTQDRAGQPLR